MPEFPGGQEALTKYLQSQVKYPPLALEARIKGKVYVSFIVNKKGTVTDVKLLRGIGGGCDEEALRVVKAMPKWKPGRIQGKKVNIKYNLPIHFKLKEEQ